MKVLLFGATGMVGQGVLRECLLDPGVELVQSVGRSPGGVAHPKLRERLHSNLFDLVAIEPDLAGFEACFFCLGVSSTGLSEAEYRRITYELTLSIAEALVRLNPAMMFIYVSGAGTDSSERGRIMWARIKGQTENALLRMPFRAVYNFRPGVIQPLHGIRSKTRLYQIFYDLLKPVLPILRRMFPAYIITTEEIGRAMLAAVRHDAPEPILETPAIRILARNTP